MNRTREEIARHIRLAVMQPLIAKLFDLYHNLEVATEEEEQLAGELADIDPQLVRGLVEDALVDLRHICDLYELNFAVLDGEAHTAYLKELDHIIEPEGSEG